MWPGVADGPGPHDARDAHERDIAREAPGEPEPAGPYARLAAAILAFDIFPWRLVAPVLRRRPPEGGETVGLSYHFIPRLHLFFAARVMRRFEDRTSNVWRTGFTYRTLIGHPMVGEETFSVEKNGATGGIMVALRSWSRPGILAARLFYPIVRRLQLRA